MPSGAIICQAHAIIVVIVLRVVVEYLLIFVSAFWCNNLPGTCIIDGHSAWQGIAPEVLTDICVPSGAIICQAMHHCGHSSEGLVVEYLLIFVCLLVQ